MRVFYPVSARLSDLLNDETSSQSGWMVLWSATSIVLLLLVVSTLPDFGGNTADRQESASKQRVNHASHARYDTRDRQDVIMAAVSANTSAQSYIDAHRCALSYTCVLPAKLPQAEPTRPQAGDGLYL